MSDRDVKYYCFGSSLTHEKPRALPSPQCAFQCGHTRPKLGCERSVLHLVPGMEAKFSKHGGWWTIVAFVTAPSDLVVGTGRLRDVRKSRKDIIKVRSKQGEGWQTVEVFDA